MFYFHSIFQNYGSACRKVICTVFTRSDGTNKNRILEIEACERALTWSCKHHIRFSIHRGHSPCPNQKGKSDLAVVSKNKRCTHCKLEWMYDDHHHSWYPDSDYCRQWDDRTDAAEELLRIPWFKIHSRSTWSLPDEIASYFHFRNALLKPWYVQNFAWLCQR